MAWSRAAGWLDLAVSRSRLYGAPDPRIEAMKGQERLERLVALRPTYEDASLLPFPGGFLAPGGPIAPRALPVRTAHGAATDLTWASTYTPWQAGQSLLLNHPTANATAAARMFKSVRPGPTVIAIHGYGAGHLRLEPWLWRVRVWRRQGLQVVFPVLPLHGVRGEPRRMPRFPGADPQLNNEGFRQAVHDLTALLGWLRSEGHGPFVVAGMSLGGLTAALLATLLPDLAGLLLVIPLSSLADFARGHDVDS